MKARCCWGLGALGVLAATAVVAAPAQAPSQARAQTPSSLIERVHARALQSFRQGRFSEAYGRFIALADDGHAASARYALWMCENGPALFGSDWDCAPHEIEDWAHAASIPAPAIGARSYRAAGKPR